MTSCFVLYNMDTMTEHAARTTHHGKFLRMCEICLSTDVTLSMTWLGVYLSLEQSSELDVGAWECNEASM